MNETWALAHAALLYIAAPRRSLAYGMALRPSKNRTCHFPLASAPDLGPPHIAYVPNSEFSLLDAHLVVQSAANYLVAASERLH